MDETVTIQFDGGADPNPGPAAFGVVVLAEDGTPLITYGKFIGSATNNVAEYHGLIEGLKKAISLGAKKALVCGDSELVVKQMRGEYRVRNEGLKPLHAKARELAEQFASIKFQHKLRHHNAVADKLVRVARKKRGEVNDVDE